MISSCFDCGRNIDKQCQVSWIKFSYSESKVCLSVLFLNSMRGWSAILCFSLSVAPFSFLRTGIWSCMYRYQTAETCFAGSPFSSAYITRSNIDYDDYGFCPDLLSNLSSFNMMGFFFPCTDWHLVGNRSSTRHDNALSLSTFPGINFLRDR